MNSAMATSQGRMRFAESEVSGDSEVGTADAENTREKSYALLGSEYKMHTRGRLFLGGDL